MRGEVDAEEDEEALQVGSFILDNMDHLSMGQAVQVVHLLRSFKTSFIGLIQDEEALRSLQSIESSQMDAPNIIPRGELDNQSR